MFAVLDIESSTKEDVKDREIFIKVLESVTKNIKHDILKERLEYDTLERVKLISNSKQFNTKLVPCISTYIYLYILLDLVLGKYLLTYKWCLYGG